MGEKGKNFTSRPKGSKKNRKRRALARRLQREGGWEAGSKVHSPELVARVLEDVRNGASTGIAGVRWGVSRGTIDSWIHRYYGSVEALRKKRKALV